MNMFFTFLIGTLATSHSTGANLTKQNRTQLELLTFFQLNNGTITWPACASAIEIVVEAANENDNILPGYELKPQIRNEGFLAVESNKELIQFMRDSEANGKLMAPAIVGPRTSCQFSATTVKSLGFVQFTPMCMGTYMYEHRNRFALVPAQGQAVAIAHSVVRFAKQIGGWKEIAIVSQQANPNTFEISLKMREIAQDEGIDVVFFASDSGFVEERTVDELKQSGARIVVVVQGQIELCLDFLCKAYRVGIRAPQYVFIQALFNCLVPNIDRLAIPDHLKCTKDEIRQQVTTMFASGTMTQPPNGSVKGAFGYDYNEFQRRFQEKTKGLSLPDYPLRLFCHDAMMAAVIAMDKAEKSMKNSSSNLTLSDFMKVPYLVQSFMKNETLRLDFPSIRIGRYKIDPSDGYIREDNFIAQAYNGSLRVKFKLPIVTEGFNGTMQMISPAFWGTKDNKIPKDLSQITIIKENCHAGPFYTIIVLSICNCIIQIAMVAKVKRFRKWIRIGFTLGSIALNIEAIFHTIGRVYIPDKECHLRPMVTIFGLSLMSSTMAYLAFKNCIKLSNARQRRKARTPTVNTPDLTVHRSRPPSRLQEQITRMMVDDEIQFRIGNSLNLIAFAFVVLSIVILSVWLSADPMRVETQSSPVFFSEPIDQYAKVEWYHCWSNNSVYWIASFVILNALLLMLTAFVNYKISKSHRIRVVKYFTYFRLTVINQFVLLLGFTLIMIVSSSLQVCIQSSIFSFSLIIYSSTCFITLFFPI